MLAGFQHLDDEVLVIQQPGCDMDRIDVWILQQFVIVCITLLDTEGIRKLVQLLLIPSANCDAL